jgi:hypothetical protein
VSDDWDELEREAEQRLEEIEQEIPEIWGPVATLAEGEHFRGFFVAEDVDTSSQFGSRPAYLLLDEEREPCWMRGGLTILDAEMDKADPQPGDLIYIARGKDGPGQQGGVAYRFVVRTKPAPQQELPADTGPQPDDDELPF